MAINAVWMSVPLSILAYARIKLDEPLWGQSFVQELLTENTWLALVLTFWPVLFSVLSTIAQESGIYEDGKKEQSANLLALVKAIDNVVGKKIRRFGELVKKLPEDCSSATIFERITQPDNQIEHLIIGVYNLCVEFTGDRDVKVVLAGIENNISTSFKAHMPNDVMPSEDVIGEDGEGSFFTCCARSNKSLYIQDIGDFLLRKKQRHRFIRTDLEDDNIGSIICFPIYHHHLNRVVYVLSLKSSRPKVFGKHFLKDYSYYIEEFIKRLELEYSLSYLKCRGKNGNV